MLLTVFLFAEYHYQTYVALLENSKIQVQPEFKGMNQFLTKQTNTHMTCTEMHKEDSKIFLI